MINSMISIMGLKITNATINKNIKIIGGFLNVSNIIFDLGVVYISAIISKAIKGARIFLGMLASLLKIIL